MSADLLATLGCVARLARDVFLQTLLSIDRPTGLLRFLFLRSSPPDHHGEVKKNFWEAPRSPSEWKSEQVSSLRCKARSVWMKATHPQTVLIILGCWGVTIKSALTYFGK